ncbi:hypothetical protein [Candidatus Harpocratesius sp.]
MKELTRKIFLLSLCNLLWGLIPLPAKQLFSQFSSFSIIFMRFLAMTIILLLIIIGIMIFEHFKKTNEEKIKVIQLWSYLLEKNADFFFFPQWLYLLVIAIFGLNVMTFLFFYCLKTIGAITTAIGVILSLIIIAGIKWGMGKEEISGFKLIYLITLIVASIILGLNSQSIESNSKFSIQSLILVIGYGVVLSFFVISSGMDRLSNTEFTIIRVNSNYKFLRVLLKLTILSILCVITFIPLLFIAKISIPNQSLQDEIALFFLELPEIGAIMFSLNGLILILGLTIAPYTLYYYLSTSWPKSAPFDLWVGVLQLLEPIINIILGVTVLSETFPTSWLFIIIFLLSISVITKFVSETQAQIHAYLFIKIEPQFHFLAMKDLYLIKSAKEVRSLVGEFDLMVEFQFPTAKILNKVIYNQISKLPGLKRYELLFVLNQSQNIDRSIPEQYKGISIKERMEFSKLSEKQSEHFEQNFNDSL